MKTPHAQIGAAALHTSAATVPHVHASAYGFKPAIMINMRLYLFFFISDLQFRFLGLIACLRMLYMLRDGLKHVFSVLFAEWN